MSDPNRSNPSPRFASDDAADDLLADILESTAAVASAEQQSLERSIREQREEATRRSLEAEQQQLAERREKLDRELERQAKLAERRTRQMRAFEASRESETPETGAQTTEAEVGAGIGIDEDELRRKIQEELREEFRALAVPPVGQPGGQPAESRSFSANQFGIFAIAVMLTLATVAGAAMMWIESGYSPDRSSYAKAVFAPADRNHLALEVGHRPLPIAEPIVKPAPEPSRATKPRRVQRPAPAKPTEPVKRITDKPEQNANSAALKRFDDMFDSSVDPFTADED